MIWTFSNVQNKFRGDSLFFLFLSSVTVREDQVAVEVMHEVATKPKQNQQKVRSARGGREKV